MPFVWMYAFCDSWTRKMWHQRSNSVFFKSCRPDTSEAAYQRYRLQSQVCGVFGTLFWLGFALGVGVPWLLSLTGGGK